MMVRKFYLALGVTVIVFGLSMGIAQLTWNESIDNIHETRKIVTNINQTQNKISENTNQINELEEKIDDLNKKIEKLQNTIEKLNQTGKNP